VSSTVLNFTLKWFINSLQKIGHCIYVLFNEQTKLFLSFESAENVPNICIPIPENGGLIKFSIGTLSAREILVKKIEIEFPAELQLTDPDGGTFLSQIQIIETTLCRFGLLGKENIRLAQSD